MKYPNKDLINRTSKKIEFTVGGELVVFQPGEVKENFDGFKAYHALNMTNTGLEEYTDKVKKEVEKYGLKTPPNYAQMKWQRLVKKLGADFKPGMMKEDVIRLLEERWQKKYGKKKSSGTKSSSSKKSSED